MIAEQFGWTLEYIDGLSMFDLHEYIQIEHGKAKAYERKASPPVSRKR